MMNFTSLREQVSEVQFPIIPLHMICYDKK